MNLESSEDLLGRNESDQIKSKLREFNGTFWKGSFPVFGFIFLYCWVYYTYVVIFLFDIMTNRKFFIYFCGGAFHVLFLLEISSFLRTVFNDAGRLPNVCWFPLFSHHSLISYPKRWFHHAQGGREHFHSRTIAKRFVFFSVFTL